MSGVTYKFNGQELTALQYHTMLAQNTGLIHSTPILKVRAPVAPPPTPPIPQAAPAAAAPASAPAPAPMASNSGYAPQQTFQPMPEYQAPEPIKPGISDANLGNEVAANFKNFDDRGLLRNKAAAAKLGAAALRIGDNKLSSNDRDVDPKNKYNMLGLANPGIGLQV